MRANNEQSNGPVIPIMAVPGLSSDKRKQVCKKKMISDNDRTDTMNRSEMGWKL